MTVASLLSLRMALFVGDQVAGSHYQHMLLPPTNRPVASSATLRSPDLLVTHLSHVWMCAVRVQLYLGEQPIIPAAKAAIAEGVIKLNPAVTSKALIAL